MSILSDDNFIWPGDREPYPEWSKAIALYWSKRIRGPMPYNMTREDVDRSGFWCSQEFIDETMRGIPGFNYRRFEDPPKTDGLKTLDEYLAEKDEQNRQVRARQNQAATGPGNPIPQGIDGRGPVFDGLQMRGPVFEGLAQPVHPEPNNSGPAFEGVKNSGPAFDGSTDGWDKIPPLTRNASEYARLAAKYPHSGDMVYHHKAVEKVRGARDSVLDAARRANVPPEAVAAAMLDENTAINNRKVFGIPAYGIADAVQDRAAQRGAKSVTYAEISQYIKENPGESSRVRSSWANPNMWDIGPYNLNLSYGAELFQKHVLAPEASGPIKDITLAGLSQSATIEEKWSAFRDRCLIDPKGGAYVTAEVLREGQERLAPYMKNKTPEEKAALLVTYFKQGWRTMKGRYDARLDREKMPLDMNPGEGARMFRNIDTIWNVLR